jgi:hypothetical protein
MEVDVGKSIMIRGVDESALPNPEALADIVGGGDGGNLQVSLRVVKDHGTLALHLQVLGAPLPEGSLADRIREKFPGLAKAEIREEVIEGTVRGTLGAKLGHALFDLDVVDEGDAEAIRQQVLKQLAAQGVEGQVSVEVQGEGPERR